MPGTPIPQLRPFDPGPQYSRIGSAIQSAAQAPLQAISAQETIKNQRLAGTKAQQDIDREIQRIKDLEEKGAKLDAYKKEKAVEIIGGQQAFDLEFGSKGKAQGRIAMATEMPDGPRKKPMEGQQAVPKWRRDLARKLMAAESKSEIQLIMQGVKKLVDEYQAVNKQLGAAGTQEFPDFSQVEAIADDKGGFSVPYPDRYVERSKKNIQTFLTKGAFKVAEDYIKNAKKDPKTKEPIVNEESYFQKLLKDPDYSEAMTDPKILAAGKAAFLGTLDRFKAETGRKLADASGDRAKKPPATTPESKGVKFAAGQEELANDNIKNAANLGLKAEHMAKKAAWERVRETVPGSEPIAQKKFNELWKAKEDEFESEASVQLLNQEAGGDFSEDAYNIVIEENGGNLPGVKNYSDWLRKANQKRPPRPEDEPGLIEKGVSAVKKAFTGGKEPAVTEPVTAPTTETFTPEQETLISGAEKKYPKRTREQIIAALRKGGHL